MVDNGGTYLVIVQEKQGDIFHGFSFVKLLVDYPTVDIYNQMSTRNDEQMDNTLSAID